MVYTFISALMPKITSNYTRTEQNLLLQCGCAGQYKNRLNFINLCYHKTDFDVECEWHFFATSFIHAYELMLGLHVFRQTGPPRRVDCLAPPSVCHIKTEASR